MPAAARGLHWRQSHDGSTVNVLLSFHPITLGTSTTASTLVGQRVLLAAQEDILDASRNRGGTRGAWSERHLARLHIAVGKVTVHHLGWISTASHAEFTETFNMAFILCAAQSYPGACQTSVQGEALSFSSRLLSPPSIPTDMRHNSNISYLCSSRKH